jgi:hypothetical protein
MVCCVCGDDIPHTLMSPLVTSQVSVDSIGYDGLHESIKFRVFERQV